MVEQAQISLHTHASSEGLGGLDGVVTTRSTSPARIRSTMFGSPSRPAVDQADQECAPGIRGQKPCGQCLVILMRLLPMVVNECVHCRSAARRGRSRRRGGKADLAGAAKIGVGHVTDVGLRGGVAEQHRRGRGSIGAGICRRVEQGNSSMEPTIVVPVRRERVTGRRS